MQVHEVRKWCLQVKFQEINYRNAVLGTERPPPFPTDGYQAVFTGVVSPWVGRARCSRALALRQWQSGGARGNAQARAGGWRGRRSPRAGLRHSRGHRLRPGLTRRWRRGQSRTCERSGRGSPFARQPPQGVWGEAGRAPEERSPCPGAPGRQRRCCSCPPRWPGPGPGYSEPCPAGLFRAGAGLFRAGLGPVRAEAGLFRAGAGLFRAVPRPGRAGADAAEAPCEGSQRHLVAAAEIAARASRGTSPNPCFAPRNVFWNFECSDYTYKALRSSLYDAIYSFFLFFFSLFLPML